MTERSTDVVKIEGTPENLAEMTMIGLETYQKVMDVCVAQTREYQGADAKRQIGVILGQILAARKLLEAPETLRAEHGDVHRLLEHLVEIAEGFMAQKLAERQGSTVQ